MDIDWALAQHRLFVETVGDKGTQLVLQNMLLPIVTWQGEDLSEAILVNVELPKADLRNTVWYQSLIGGCRFIGANFTGSTFVKAAADHADFSNANMQACNLFRGSFIAASFRGANLTGARCEKALLMQADFRDACLRDVDFAGASLDGCHFAGAVLQGAKNLKQASVGTIFIENGQELEKPAAKAWLLQQAVRQVDRGDITTTQQ